MANMLSPLSPSWKIVAPTGKRVVFGEFLKRPNFRAMEVMVVMGRRARVC